MFEQFENSRRICAAVAAVLALVAVARVVSSYSHTAQTFDEPYHVAAAIELLDRGTYTLDPLHPPLQRIAIGIPLYLSGERFPEVASSQSDASTTPYLCAVGNAILNDTGHYARNLTLARLGMLPFLALGMCGSVFLGERGVRELRGNDCGGTVHDGAYRAGVFRHRVYRHGRGGNAGCGLLGLC